MNDVVFSCDTHYISYLGRVDGLVLELDKFLTAAKGLPKSNVGRSETALVIYGPDDNRKFLILYGDHSEQYKELGEDLDACKKYFLANKDQMGHTSDTIE